jgi:RNA-directed DNA polymerase
MLELTPKCALERVKIYTEERMRTHLRRRYKIKCRKTAITRFPRSVLYNQNGLYPVPVTAKWKHNAL